MKSMLDIENSTSLIDFFTKKLEVLMLTLGHLLSKIIRQKTLKNKVLLIVGTDPGAET